MKNGDLIHMPAAKIVAGEEFPVVGIVVDDNPPASVSSSRIGIMWTDNWGRVDYEPKAWLEVISAAVPVEA